MAPSAARLSARGAPCRTLTESDYLLWVPDETRLGALCFCLGGSCSLPRAPPRAGVPALIELGRLLKVTETYFLRDEETDEDLQLTLFAPGSSRGGARPKASVIDPHGHLSRGEVSAKRPTNTAWRHGKRSRFASPSAPASLCPCHQFVNFAGRKRCRSRRGVSIASARPRVPFPSAIAIPGSQHGADV